MDISRRDFIKRSGEAAIGTAVVAAGMLGSRENVEAKDASGKEIEGIEGVEAAVHNPDNPYPTVWHSETGLEIRSAGDPSDPKRPTRMGVTEDGIEIGYVAGHRDRKNEAVIQLWASKKLSPGTTITFKAQSVNHATRSGSRKPEDNNTFVVAELLPDGTTGKTYRTFVDTSEGLWCEQTGEYVSYNTDGWTGSFSLKLDDIQEGTALAFIGRPATTANPDGSNGQPEAGMSLRISTDERSTTGSPESMIGDNQLWLDRPVNVDQLMAAVQRSRQMITMPDTGLAVLPGSQEVKGFLIRTKNYTNQLNRSFRELVLVQLACASRGVSPDTVTIGQKKPVGTQLFRSEDRAGRQGRVILHGLCTVKVMAEQVAAAYKSIRGAEGDPNNASDLEGLEHFLGNVFQ